MDSTVNSIYVLFSILLFTSIFVLVIHQFDILTPSFLMSFTMTISVLMAMLNVDRWGLLVRANTSLFIIGSIWAFILGGLWVTKFQLPINSNDRWSLPSLSINYSIIYFLSFFMLIFCYFSFKELYDASIMLGNHNGYTDMIKVVRRAIEGHDFKFSRWMSYRLLFAQLVASISLYLFVFKLYYKDFSLKLFTLLIPVFLYIPFLIFSTGRLGMMKLVIFILLIVGILYKKYYGRDIKAQRTLIIFMGIAGISFILIFLLMGNFTGKVVSESRTPFIIFSHYAGLSVPALDIIINEPNLENIYIGSNTLDGIYRLLQPIGKFIGFNTPEVQRFLPFVQFDGITTNVYTALGRYYRDYGYIGTFVVMWLLGVFFTAFYNKTMNNISTHRYIILYSFFAFPLFLSSIDERFFLDIINTSTIYSLILYWCLEKIICKRDSYMKL